MSATPSRRTIRDPAVMGGRPCIRGLRVTVGMILGELGDGVAVDERLAARPHLDRENVLEAIRCGAWLAQEPETATTPWTRN